jgi:hypothetical protein
MPKNFVCQILEEAKQGPKRPRVLLRTNHIIAKSGVCTLASRRAFPHLLRKRSTLLIPDEKVC